MWKVPRIWDGGECWIIGGGPSLTEEFGIPKELVTEVKKGEQPPSSYSPYMEALHDKHLIGINAAFRLGNWIEFIFFGDGGFYLKNRKSLLKHPGLKVSCSPKIDTVRFKSAGVKYLQRDHNRAKGISKNLHKVSWNNNSGGAAISFAVHLGVSRIILLGFDMCNAGDHSQHWHNLYGRSSGQPPKKPHRLPFHRHLLGFPFIAEDAKKMGIEIINASPNSAIEEFPKVKVKELL